MRDVDVSDPNLEVPNCQKQRRERKKREVCGIELGRKARLFVDRSRAGTGTAAAGVG